MQNGRVCESSSYNNNVVYCIVVVVVVIIVGVTVYAHDYCRRRPGTDKSLSQEDVAGLPRRPLVFILFFYFRPHFNADGKRQNIRFFVFQTLSTRRRASALTQYIIYKYYNITISHNIRCDL